MSESKSSIIFKDDTSLVIPTVTSLRYTKISNKDEVLSIMITVGYLETTSLEVAMYLRLYFHQSNEYGFKVIGSIDRVKTKDGDVYRQRVGFSSFSNLLKLLKYFKITLVIPTSLRIMERHFKKCMDSMSVLNRVCPIKDKYKWLTNTMLLQLVFICDISEVAVKIGVELKDLAERGILSRSPYICGSVLDDGKNSSIIVIPFSYYKDNELLFLLGDKPKYYRVKVDKKSIPIFGYSRVTTKPFLRGKRLDVISNDRKSK